LATATTWIKPACRLTIGLRSLGDPQAVPAPWFPIVVGQQPGRPQPRDPANFFLIAHRNLMVPN
jgi:hypothetical protein